jgi:hypothetical protein
MDMLKIYLELNCLKIACREFSNTSWNGICQSKTVLNVLQVLATGLSPDIGQLIPYPSSYFSKRECSVVLPSMSGSF